ncbi:hypothetical protein ACSLFT_33610 (plasmid) [Streptomyces sp. G6]|uniref:hypothetical protein n=1 Tax=Streptomyces sp. G6 TaxID=1178736 RepID=UPI003EDB127E
MISRAPLPLRLVSRVLMACALTLCLTGVARPATAMVMSAPMESMERMSGASDVALPTARAATVVDSLSSEDSCPSSPDDCAQPPGTPPHGTPAAPACADGQQEPVAAVQPGNPRSGVPPPVESVSPPDLHRLCVSRT